MFVVARTVCTVGFIRQVVSLLNTLKGVGLLNLGSIGDDAPAPKAVAAAVKVLFGHGLFALLLRAKHWTPEYSNNIAALGQYYEYCGIAQEASMSFRSAFTVY